jgi:hypothetical protein
MTNISAKLKAGIMFTIVVVSLREEGIKYFTQVLGSPQRANEMRQVFQMLLSYWVWLKRDSYWKRGDKDAKESARKAIRVMLRELIRLWPRIRGNGWEKAKIHEQLHVPDDIERNEAPQGSHTTGPTEHNHIRLVKRPAKGTQQRAKVFDRQLGQRVSDAYIVHMAYQRMTTNFDQPSQFLSSLVRTTGLSPQASKGWLYIENNPAQSYFCRCALWSNAKEEHFSLEMLEFLVQHYASLPGSQYPLIGPGLKSYHRLMYLSTEYRRSGGIFCGQAHYRLQGPWYDWVMLRWAREDNQRYAGDADCQAAYGGNEVATREHLYAPGTILGFVTPMPVDWNGDTGLALLGGVMAVVSTCDFSHSRELVFSTKWQQSYVYHTRSRKTPNIQLVDVNAIVRHCLIVPHEGDQSSFHKIWCQELWDNESNDCSCTICDFLRREDELMTELMNHKRSTSY